MMYNLLVIVLLQQYWIVSQAGKLMFDKIQQNLVQFYVLKSEVGNLKINLKLSIDPENISWIKGFNCKYCTPFNKCQQSCSSKQHFGVQCGNNYCEYASGKQLVKYKQIQGKQAIINLEIGQSQQFSCPMIIAQKMKTLETIDGVINPLLPNLKIFNKIQIVKDHQAGIQMWHTEKYQGKVVGNPIIIENDKKYNVNNFEASQIHIISEHENQNKQVKIPISHISAKFSVETSLLVFPKKIYNKIMHHINSQYFKDNKCVSEDNNIKCQKMIDFQHVSTSKMQITLNGVEVSFPLQSLFISCKDKQCQTYISSNKNIQDQIVIGDFIFNVFAIEFDLEFNVQLQRLDNQWAKLYKEDRLHTKQQLGFVWGMVTLSFTAIWYFLKFIFYLALVSVFLNCIYRRKQLCQWFIGIFNRLGSKKNNATSKNNAYDKDKTHLISQGHVSVNSDELQ